MSAYKEVPVSSKLTVKHSRLDSEPKIGLNSLKKSYLQLIVEVLPIITKWKHCRKITSRDFWHLSEMLKKKK